jgi:hypothetical protein
MRERDDGGREREEKALEAVFIGSRPAYHIRKMYILYKIHTHISYT